VPGTMRSFKPYKLDVSINNSDKITMKNILNNSNIFLSYHWYKKDMSIYKWDNNRASINLLSTNEYSASIDIYAPSKPGVYYLQIDIVEEGVQWFISAGLLDIDLIKVKAKQNILGYIKSRISEAILNSNPVLYYSLRSLMLSLLIKDPLKQYKNYGKGKRCFIIGNGPSLNNIDITLLKDEVTFGVNGIFLLYDKMGFEPTFYLINDNLVMEDRCKDIDAFVCKSIKIIPRNYIRKITNKENTHFVEFYDVFNYKMFPYFSKSPTKYCWNGGTVSYFCMQMAFYFGFSEVYLVGFDHYYTIPESAEVNGVHITSTDDDVNHFSPDYFGKGYKWHDPMVNRMEVSYKKAKKVYEKHGRKIYNATKGGNLEVFPRVDFKSLFSNSFAGD